jgi:hypothetical protein
VVACIDTECSLSTSVADYAGEMYITTESVCFILKESTLVEEGIPRQFAITITNITGVRLGERTNSLNILIRTDQYSFVDVHKVADKVTLIVQIWCKNMRSILKKSWQHALSIHNIGSTGSGMQHLQVRNDDNDDDDLLAIAQKPSIVAYQYQDDRLIRRTCDVVQCFSSAWKTQAQDSVCSKVLLLGYTAVRFPDCRDRHCCIR